MTVLMGMKKFAYPYFMPPDIPPDRADALEAAFLATMRDKDFLAEIKKMRGDIVPNSGAEMQGFVNAAYDLPADIVDKTRRLLAPSQK
jgi:tripartite-type tricarboxylate transporter receptor subunit TctC